jgi:hypothetical protein
MLSCGGEMMGFALLSPSYKMFLLALCAFWDNALGAGHVFNPFGIMFLLLGGAVWCAWRPIHDGFVSAKNESELPIIRMAAKTIEGMLNLTNQPRRRSTRSS